MPRFTRSRASRSSCFSLPLVVLPLAPILAPQCCVALASSAIVRVRRAAPPCSAAEAAHRRRVDAALLEFWNVDDGYGGVDRGSATTYGEVTPAGARRIARALGVDGTEGDPVVFMDLGSGVGKLVVQAWLEWPRVVCSTGVELTGARAARASARWHALAGSGRAERLRTAIVGHEGRSETRPGVRLLEGDVLQSDVREVTHAYCSSLCFDDDLLAALGSKLAAEAPQLRAVASLRRFPSGLSLRVVGEVEAEMSWTNLHGTRVYLYEPSSERGSRF